MRVLKPYPSRRFEDHGVETVPPPLQKASAAVAAAAAAEVLRVAAVTAEVPGRKVVVAHGCSGHRGAGEGRRVVRRPRCRDEEVGLECLSRACVEGEHGRERC